MLVEIAHSLAWQRHGVPHLPVRFIGAFGTQFAGRSKDAVEIGAGDGEKLEGERDVLVAAFEGYDGGDVATG